MCVVSMVMDYYWDRWNRPPYQVPYQNDPDPGFIQPYPPMQPNPFQPRQVPNQIDLDELQKLLKRAREYDKKHQEPACEMEEKKQRLLKLAKELGVNIYFILEEK